LQAAAAHALRAHVCGLSSVFAHAHVAGKNRSEFFRVCGRETLRGFFGPHGYGRAALFIQ